MEEKRKTIKISASYVNCAYNFIIYNMLSGKLHDQELASFIAVLKNILSRDYPVKPSEYLKGKLGFLNNEEIGEQRYFIDKNKKVPEWRSTIKGADNGYNPATDFFYKLWPTYLREYSWVRQLTIPEAPIDEILDTSDEYKDQAVDFYIPSAKLIIEIDGSQHKEQLQTTIDYTRDSKFRASGNLCVRIKTEDLRERNEAFLKAIEKIRTSLQESKEIQKTEDISKRFDSNYKLFANYEKAIRYQFVILSLIENGILDISAKEWKFNIVKQDHQVFYYACNDIFQWLGNLYGIKNKEISFPKLVAEQGKDGICINIELFGRKDETNAKEIVVYSDYWTQKSKDYYHINTAELIDYHIEESIDEKNVIIACNKKVEKSLQFVLKNIFSYKNFNPGQLDIICNILNRKKTIGILPTGGGKSLCYQLAAMLQPGVSFSVCPIVSLEMDQKAELQSIGIGRTEYIASSLDEATKEKYNQDSETKDSEIRKKINDNFASGKYQILLISPERFQNADFREKIKIINQNLQFAYAIIDEVHCLSEWGHDFRTSYLTLIPTIEKYVPEATLVGLTATASQAVLKDLKIEFEIEREDIISSPSLSRPNLNFQVIQTGNKNEQLKEKLNEIADSNNIGIIFTLYRDKTGDKDCNAYSCKVLETIREVAPELTSEKYNSGLDNKTKSEVQEAFKKGNINVLSATKAFGMGINKKDIRYTIHYELPWSVEAFYQEAGRAGRDAELIEKADCIILYTPEDPEIKEEADGLFSPRIKSEEIIKTQNKYKDQLNDVGKIFYLFNQNNPGIETEISNIGQVVGYLNRCEKKKNTEENIRSCEIKVKAEGKSFLQEGMGITSGELEKALYRLRILGAVKDWTIKYAAGEKIFTVIMANEGEVTEDLVEQKFVEYVKRHEPVWDINESEQKEYKSILEDKSKKYIRRYAEALITWTYNVIVFSRRRMISNIRDLCIEYKNSEDFSKRITEFLQISNVSQMLQDIVEGKIDWKHWLDIFKGELYNEKNEKNINREEFEKGKCREISSACARFKESYLNVPGLDLIYVLSDIMSGRYSRRRDLDLLVYLLALCQERKKPNEDEIFGLVVPFLEKNRKDISDEIISEISGCLAEFKNEWADELFEIFEDDGSLTVILNRISEEINTSMEVIR